MHLLEHIIDSDSSDRAFVQPVCQLPAASLWRAEPSAVRPQSGDELLDRSSKVQAPAQQEPFLLGFGSQGAGRVPWLCLVTTAVLLQHALVQAEGIRDGGELRGPLLDLGSLVVIRYLRARFL